MQIPRLGLALLLGMWVSLAMAADPPQRKLAWSYKAPSSNWKVVSATEHGVFIRGGQKIAVLHPKTGKIRWESKLPIHNTPLQFGDKWVLYPEPNTEINVVRLTDGKLDHKIKRVASYTVIDGKRIIGTGQDGFTSYQLPKKKLWAVKDVYAYTGERIAYVGNILVTHGKRVKGTSEQRLAGINLKNGLLKWEHPLGIKKHNVWVDKSASDQGWKLVPREFATTAHKFYTDGKDLAVLVRTVVGVTSKRVRKSGATTTWAHGLLFLNARTGTRRKAKVIDLVYKKEDKPDSIELSMIEDKGSPMIVARYTHKSRAEYRFDLYQLKSGFKRATVRWTGYDSVAAGVGGKLVLSGGTGGEKFEVREASVRSEPKVLFTGTGSVLGGAHLRKEDYLVLRKKPDGSMWLQSVEAKKGGVNKEVRAAGQAEVWYGRHEKRLMALDKSTWKMLILNEETQTAKAIVQCPVSTTTVLGIKGGVVLWSTSGSIARIDFK